MATATKKKKAPAKKAAAKKVPAAPKAQREDRRPAATLDRDEVVYTYLKTQGPSSLANIQENANLDNPKLAYNCLVRLSRANRVTKERDGSRTPKWVTA